MPSWVPEPDGRRRVSVLALVSESALVATMVATVATVRRRVATVRVRAVLRA